MMRTLLAFLLFLPSTLLAQRGDEENLYIPPTLTVTTLDSGGAPVLKGKEIRAANVMPLLPVLFFDHPGEWTIPGRYRTLTGSVQADRYADTDPIWSSNRVYAKYYELLDIVGFRLSFFPTTSITLRGGYSAEPGESPEIAAARAETVRDYLTRVWRVASARITIAEPERLSDAEENVFDHEEARRVLIESSDWEILRPVRFASRRASIDPLGFRCRVATNVPPHEVASITLSVIVDDREAGRVVIPGDPATGTYEMWGSWKWIGHESTATFSTVMIDAMITTTDGALRRATPVTIRRTTFIDSVPMKTTSRVELPFFSHRDSRLNRYHTLLLQRIVDADTTARSLSVEIEGGSDAWEMLPIGEDAVMLHQRARASIDSVAPETFFKGPYVWSGTMGLLSVRLDGRRWSTSGPDPMDEYIDRNRVAPITRSLPQAAPERLRDTLGIARRDAVLAYLRDSLGRSIVEPLDTAPPPAGEQRTPPLLPELRCYARGVSLLIQRVTPATVWDSEEEW